MVSVKGSSFGLCRTRPKTRRATRGVVVVHSLVGVLSVRKQFSRSAGSAQCAIVERSALKERQRPSLRCSRIAAQPFAHNLVEKCGEIARGVTFGCCLVLRALVLPWMRGGAEWAPTWLFWIHPWKSHASRFWKRHASGSVTSDILDAPHPSRNPKHS